MAVLFRAMVMLLVLVGLPAAWVYYGPLPGGAQRCLNRMMEIGRTALTKGTDSLTAESITAPAYSVVSEPIRYDPQTAPASFTRSTASLAEKSALQEQLEPHLSLLRKLGASEYTLEDWGENGQLVRFRCDVSVGSNSDLTRHFEAVAANSLAAVQEVVGEVTSWQNALGGRTQWR